jgi:hypothetical protein
VCSKEEEEYVMRIKSISFVLVSVLILSTSYAEVNSANRQEYNGSFNSVDDSVNDVQLANSPYLNGETSNWGSGIFLGAKTGTEYTMNLEIGYMFKLNKNPLGWMSREYIEERKSYRIGLSAGIQMFNDELVFQDDLSFYRSNGYGVFGKINFGSPILLNFLSFSWHLKMMYTIPESGSGHNISDPRMVFGYGNDIEFWLTENACASIGFTDERDSMFGENKDDPIYPPRIRFVFGFKTFF